MKKIAVILILLLSGEATWAQSEKILIYEKDGSVISYDVDSITKITFTNEPSPWYYEMNVFALIIPSPYKTTTSEVDSLTFGDTLSRKYVQIDQYDGDLNNGSERFPISGQYPLDSITFAEFEEDTNVIKLPSSYWDIALGGDSGYGNYHSAVWRGNRIYCSQPGRYFDLDSNLNIVKDTLFDQIGGPWLIGGWSLALDSQGNRLLSIQSPYSLISIGSLVEDRLDSATYEVLDSTDQISSAVYFPGTDNIIYYAYGSYSASNQTPADAGYYMLDRASGVKTLLLKHISDLGPNEIINGFDIRPDGTKLLFASTGQNRAPLAIEYDLSSHVLDTLNVQFDSLWGLWLRYNHDGSKILYNNYPTYSGGFASTTCETGIIDRSTLSKHILSTNPDNELTYLCEFPEWSPDELHIIYGVAPILVEPPGEIGDFQLCILKSIQ